MVQICVTCNQQNMHLAEGATPGTNSSSGGDERMMPYTNSATPSQISQREQVPPHVQSPQVNAPTPVSLHSSMQGSVNTSSIGPMKSSMHDGALNVRYKVNSLEKIKPQKVSNNLFLSSSALRFIKLFQRSVR